MEWSWSPDDPEKRAFPTLYTYADAFGPRLHRFPGRPTVFPSAGSSSGSETTIRNVKERTQLSERGRLTIYVIGIVVIIAAVVAVVIGISLGLPKNDDEIATTTIASTTTEPYKGVPVDGHWSDWGPWTKCTKTCGFGSKVRNRKCDDPRPEYGGKNCSGKSEENTECSTWSCPGELVPSSHHVGAIGVGRG